MAEKNIEFVNRELSWLSFNERVLQEAEDKTVPLIERIKFMGIFSNNRDEFFRVRVATIKRMLKLGRKANDILGEDPEILLGKIQKTVIGQTNKFDGVYEELLHELGKQNIYILNERMLNEEHGKFVRQYFHDEVMPALVPIMVDDAPQFPYLRDKSVYFLTKINRVDKKPKYSLIEIPSEVLPRFVVLPKQGEKKYIILLDDVIRYCLNDVFSIFEHESIEAYSIKMTRDAELDIDNDITKSIVEKIAKSLKKRKKGTPVRLIYDSDMPIELLDFLMRKIKLIKNDSLIPGGRYHNFKDFLKFPNVGGADLQYKNSYVLDHEAFSSTTSYLKAIRKKDILLFYPYHNFHHIIDVLREASIDPKVVSIKATLYRVAKHSRIVNALINAVKNGKKVTVVVELQARFDEEANLHWSDKLKEEGVNVIYGVPGLKIHSKLFLITRRENGKAIKYAHVGTGNFNEQTAKVYADCSLLTCNKRITEDLTHLFDFYANATKHNDYRSLLVAPFFMRKKLNNLINREIENAKAGKPAYILLKLNNLVDREIIKKLYDASGAGVNIKLIIRGICCLIPGDSFSKNIEAISIVDKYLEHSRVFIFCNGGREKYFLSSADWMKRNLDSRSEVAIPIYDKEIQRELLRYIEIQWNDNTKARIINKKQDNQYRMDGEKTKVRAQDDIYKWLKQKKTKSVAVAIKNK
ncbi:MAG: polyphosphate kinase 1 [Bacteroidia bacterium]|nr:polyphosphate kinase 1 [Bacteroidia bacterium]